LNAGPPEVVFQVTLPPVRGAAPPGKSWTPFAATRGKNWLLDAKRRY
jgi:hypothetical protein